MRSIVSTVFYIKVKSLLIAAAYTDFLFVVRARCCHGVLLTEHNIHLRILDATQLAFNSHPVYEYLVTDFGNVAALNVIPWCVLLSTGVLASQLTVWNM